MRWCVKGPMGGLVVVLVALMGGCQGAAMDLATLIHQYEDQVLGDRGARAAVSQEINNQVKNYFISISIIRPC